MYSLHFNALSQSEFLDLTAIELGKKVIEQLKSLKWFLTLHGDTLVFSRGVQCDYLIEVPTELPLTHCYKVDSSTAFGVKLSQLITDWVRAETAIKNAFGIQPEDTVMYFEKLDGSYIVKTHFNRYARQGMTAENPKAILGRIRDTTFQDDMLDVAHNLLTKVERESNPIKRTLAAARLRSMIQTCQFSGINLPRKFSKYSTVSSFEDESGLEFD